MGIQQSETSENRAEQYSLIETKYTGDNPELKGTKGEAYFDANLNQWFYRTEEAERGEGFRSVDAKEIECAADKGWLKGNYVGLRSISKQGKAYWDENLNMWNYRPEGTQRDYYVIEGNFIPVRDVDVFDKD